MTGKQDMKRVILLLESSREFGRQLIIGIAHYSRLRGPWVFYKEPVDVHSSIPHLARWKPDGMILRDSMISKELLKLNIPTVLAIHDSSSPMDVPVIKTDSRSIAKMASRHFIDRGFRNLAYCGFRGYDWSEERKINFERYNQKAGIETHIFQPSTSTRKLNWEYEQRHVKEWVAQLPKPVGIFACNDDRGQQILEVCKLLDLKVPEEVAVIGVDNDPMICEFEEPPLTSIALNTEAAGFEAAKLLDRLMQHNRRSSERIMVYPTHIVQRQSSDILAVNDPEVSLATQFIIGNAKNKIFVCDVVKITSLGRRTLEKRFKKTFHRSIYNEIQRVRVELVSKLLMETDLPISEITSLFNFTDAEHISRFFKKEKGMNLREFRKFHRPL